MSGAEKAQSATVEKKRPLLPERADQEAEIAPELVAVVEGNHNLTLNGVPVKITGGRVIKDKALITALESQGIKVRMVSAAGTIDYQCPNCGERAQLHAGC